jgi:hypothetical protein
VVVVVARDQLRRGFAGREGSETGAGKSVIDNWAGVKNG